MEYEIKFRTSFARLMFLMEKGETVDVIIDGTESEIKIKKIWSEESIYKNLRYPCFLCKVTKWGSKKGDLGFYEVKMDIFGDRGILTKKSQDFT